MLWEKIKANIHMPCSVQSPHSYALSASSDRCLPGSLCCALGLRFNICHSLKAAPLQVPDFSSSFFKYPLPTLWRGTLRLLIVPRAASLRREHRRACVIVSGGGLGGGLRLSPPLLRVLLAPLLVIQKGY